jgi:hypothetical protein
MLPVFLVPLLTLFLLLPATPAWALQTHGDPEGLYVHQIAHLLFAVALAYLWWHTRRTPPLASGGWKLLQLFCLLTILWNLLAVVGHEVYLRLDAADFLKRNTWEEQVVLPLDLRKSLYLLTAMDHLLLVPALAALALALRTFYRQILAEEQR